MDVSRLRALRGPNLWSHHTAIEAIVSCSPEECAIGVSSGFEERLRARFPNLRPLQPTRKRREFRHVVHAQQTGVRRH